MVITIHIEAVRVQGVGAQLGDTVGLLTQFPVQLFSVQSEACWGQLVGAEGTHPGASSILVSPEQADCTASVEGTSGAVLKQRRQRQLQVSFGGTEYCGV